VLHGAYPLIAAARAALHSWRGFVLRALMPVVQLVDAIAYMRSTEKKRCLKLLVVRLEACDQRPSSSVYKGTSARRYVFFFVVSAQSCPSCRRGIG